MAKLKEENNHPQSQAMLGIDQGIAVNILQALVLEATDCIAVKDVQGRYLLINPAGASFLGRDAREILGKTDFDLFSTEAALKIRETDEQVMFTGETQLIEDLLSPLHSEKRYFQAMKCVYKSPTGEIQGIINVVRDITERKLAELALQKANQDLDQFASIVSHDLQAPLRKINYFTSALEEVLEVIPEEARDYLNRIQKTSQKMQGLITDILNLSRIKRQPPRYSTVNLKDLTEEAIQELGDHRPVSKHFFRLGQLGIELEADAVQIRQLLINLFSNAIKFQKPGATPVIHVYADLLPNHRCLLTIQDNGIGLEGKYLARIFKAFERLHSSVDYPGNGMGLAICERIIERHNGAIRVESTLGTGTTFHIELPLTQAPK